MKGEGPFREGRVAQLWLRILVRDESENPTSRRKDFCRRECEGDRKVVADDQAALKGVPVPVVGNHRT